MKVNGSWHEEDNFWEAFGPFMFDEGRLAATPAEVDQVLNMLDLRPGTTILDL